ncbi:MAG: hypothetical protein ACD_84C00011G0003 [uncultured bacterium]|nr:MAG: hypothetical protein ACD_84C00011G0003 [uncultured bacterium]
MSFSVAEIGINSVRKILDLWRGTKFDSLIDYTRTSRVEPIVLIDTDALYLDSLPEVQQSLLSIFAGYYLQAIAISTTVGKIDVMRHLDRLNPHRNAGDSAEHTMGYLLAEESYKDGLPMHGSQKVALEATPEQAADQNLRMKQLERNDKLTASEMSFGRDTMKDLKELANLSVGKMFSVEITDGMHKASIPVSIRLMASSLPSANLIHILSLGSQDNSMKERYHAWRSGRLEFIKDLVLCQDLIDAHRKNLMSDNDGIYTNLIKRARGNQLSTIVSANPSVATASNMIIMTNTTAEELEVQINGKLRDFKTRERLFADSYLMIAVIVDKQWERVTFYHRGLNAATEVSMRDLKASNKGSGPDVSEILAAYRVGNSPSL